MTLFTILDAASFARRTLLEFSQEPAVKSGFKQGPVLVYLGTCRVVTMVAFLWTSDNRHYLCFSTFLLSGAGVVLPAF